MNASEANKKSPNEKRFTLSIDPARHKRVKFVALQQDVTARDLVECILDYTLPLVESGELKIQKPSVSEA